LKQAASFHERSSKLYGSEEVRLVIAGIREVSHKLTFPFDVRRRAAEICTNADVPSFGRGIPPAVLAAAILYIACREKNTPVTLKEFAVASDSDPREVGRCYLHLLENMHISRPRLNGKGYVNHIALKKPASEEALGLSQDIINTMSAKGHGGRNPMTLAAASLYLACCSLGENVTQAEVAEGAGVGEESVRECCKEIRTLAKPSSA
jgi:transcription initiation factor TFIIB